MKFLLHPQEGSLLLDSGDSLSLRAPGLLSGLQLNSQSLARLYMGSKCCLATDYWVMGCLPHYNGIKGAARRKKRAVTFVLVYLSNYLLCMCLWEWSSNSCQGSPLFIGKKMLTQSEYYILREGERAHADRLEGMEGKGGGRHVHECGMSGEGGREGEGARYQHIPRHSSRLQAERQSREDIAAHNQSQHYH